MWQEYKGIFFKIPKLLEIHYLSTENTNLHLQDTKL